MTIRKTTIIWDDGINRLCFLPVEENAQYNYIKDIHCISFDVSFENTKYKGYDRFTLFDKGYADFSGNVKARSSH